MRNCRSAHNLPEFRGISILSAALRRLRGGLLACAAGAGLAVALMSAPLACAQSLEDLNVQLHGYAMQGFLYSTNNNWNTADSSDGSAAWTEAVVNLTVQPQPKLRIGVQARYFLLGNYGDQITLDWAQVDYQVNERFGIRAGKVKSPTGLLNETQDIDPVQLWTLLPQSIYPIASRNSALAHYGGVVYGTVSLGEGLGKLIYRGFGGERVIGSNDSYLQPLRDLGWSVPNGVSGRAFGGMLSWQTPVDGLTVGAADSSDKFSGMVDTSSLTGEFEAKPFTVPDYFGRYERRRLMLAAEYMRLAVTSTVDIPAVADLTETFDQRAFYAMASCKLTDKLTAGAYYSGSTDRQAALTSARYQKDWAFSSRYDFNPYLYAKFEQHLMRGTEIGFSSSDNAALQPNTRMTLLKLGVSF